MLLSYFVLCRRGIYSVFIKLHRDVLQPVSTLSVLRLVLPYSAISALDDATPSHCKVLQNLTTYIELIRYLLIITSYLCLLLHCTNNIVSLSEQLVCKFPL